MDALAGVTLRPVKTLSPGINGGVPSSLPLQADKASKKQTLKTSFKNFVMLSLSYIFLFHYFIYACIYCVGSLALIVSVAVVGGGVSPSPSPPPLAASKPTASAPRPTHNHLLDDSSSVVMGTVPVVAILAASPLDILTLSGENE